LLCFEGGKTLLHRAFEQKQPGNILLLLEKGADLFQQDNDGKSALDLCPSDFRDEFRSIEFSEKALLQRDFALWFHLIQIPEMETISITSILTKLVLKYPVLAEAKDALGRQALNVATSSNQRALNSILLIHGR
jgi:ankyrin repeat protein